MNQNIINNYKSNILVVDDTPANLRLLVGILTEKGYKVRPVPNGELALSAAKGIPPDLILLDIMMPGIDGYQVCTQLKADETTKDIPVIFISAISDVVDKVKGFAVGGVDYITKPFHIEEVLARVETHLSICYLQRSLKTKNDELSQALQQLKNTQNHLIQSEKMVALGQLIAGVAHELNTPLGAIRSSIGNITDFLHKNLAQLPQFFQNLSPQRQADFFNLLQTSLDNTQTNSLSSKEKRQLKRALQQQISDLEIANSDSVANILVSLGVGEDIQPFFPLLTDPNLETILKTTYQLFSLQKSAQTIATATDRAAKVVFALRSYARYDYSGEKVEANIIDGIETVLTLYHNQCKQGVEVIRNYGELPAIQCYPDELNQVWINLIHNSLQAMDNQGTITINTRQNQENILVSFTDTGKGIPPEIIQKIFAPFFTTKPTGEGSGLGLDIVRRIIEKHQGKIEVESIPGKTTFTVSLPIQINKESNHV
ncbi:MAG TPA: hybrid sensor histidine kinase/response regulator [Cyanobacteria bacterium UBA11149]|nr:hybrid sensor histidine kinase/response regulator [Cyanobacteria bacterium UBA11367]HBE57149.1 hybrid sensor histidine kinase/response regulator [Cyanobacteria bacterium UBA11366]HBK63494.1 hybrid sensor histidine kinase/response regulator [Cyanobacteria bacterium UBA11166]HBR72840.1 hybrid sensor histidine kinase/response regulator [Cyanobacteria bacterium UBA11159]HBS67804.1 hybrid sensor histidine kinase/response regulator [Cyanobacteria bacterium UBA11153]HBW91578.1 hybrid sensor histid